MFDNYYAVIMAGGSGTRLWPLSRKDQPKQSLVINGKKTLFQYTVDRLTGLFPFERILVVTVATQVESLRDECPEIPIENYVLEPLPRGTASVAGLAALAIKNRNPQGVMAILPADHLIENEIHLHQLLKAAYGVAEKNFLVTLGITPSFPATGYGYIQKGESLGEFSGLEVYQVKKFKEKPDHAQAEILAADGEHVWNSGMFIWRVNAVMDAFQKQMGDLFSKLIDIDADWQTDKRESTLEKIWPTINPQTIDYGIMEKAEDVAVVPSIGLGWSDVGSWESLFDALEGDSTGNIILRGETVTFDTQGTLICEDSSERLVVAIGVKDLIIIDSGNSVLVCDRKYAQRVREVVKYLEQNGREQYL